MRKKRPIVGFTMIFIMYLAVIFSGAEQDKLIRKVNHRSLKNIYTIKDYYSPQLRCVPNEIIVKFKTPLSDYEKARIIDRIESSHNFKHLSQNVTKTGCDNFYRILIPENSSMEGMIAILNRNPDVEYAEPNHIVRIQVPSNGHREHFTKKIQPINRKHIMKISEQKKAQPSYNRPDIRSKAKIYKSRDSKGRLVIANYSLSKSNTKKK